MFTVNVGLVVSYACFACALLFGPLLFLFLLLLFTPGAVWGALGGLRPLLGELEGLCPSIELLFNVGPVRGLLPPFQGGLGGFYV